MLRKILSISLVAVMLSTVAFATEFLGLNSVHAAAETAENGMTAYYIDSDTVPGKTDSLVDNATERVITKVEDGSASVGKGNWLVYKFDLGKTYESVTDVTFSFRAYIPNSSSTSTNGYFVYLITEAYYNSIALNEGQTLTHANMQNIPVKPLGSDMIRLKKAKANSGTAVTGETRTYDISVTFTSEAILNQAMDGKVYLAVCGAHQNYGNKISTGEINTNETYAITVSIPAITVNGTEGESTATKVNDFSDAVLMWDGSQEATEGNSFDVCTQTTSGTAKLLAVTYSGATMTDVEVIPVDAATNTTGVISGTVPALTAGDSLKIYLWKGDTLVPITDIIEF